MFSFLRSLFGDSSAVQVAAADGHTPQPAARVRRIYGSDRIGLVGFNNSGFIIAVPADPFAPWLLERSRRLHKHVQGQTNIADGLRKALEIFQRTPTGVWNRIWLLSDGYPNVEVEQIMPTVRSAVEAGIKVNTIGFGNEYDEELLRQIAETARGRFVSVQTLRELTAVLVKASGRQVRRNRRRHQSETTVLVIDLSGSMSEPMEEKTKVAVVEEAVVQLLHYKQKCWS